METVRVRPLECGWLTSDAGTMAEGALGRIRMPVGAFLVEHPAGTLVFDTGMHPEVARTKDRMRSTAPLFDVELDDHWTLAGQLGELGLSVDDVDLAVVSHLHFDHGGGLGQLPGARLVVQRAEWEEAFDEGLVDFGVYNPDDFDLGHDRQVLDGEHDVFGDGSVLAVPTPGHTAGHQSLLIEGRLLLVGDACYTQHALDHDVVPPFGHDRHRQREVYGWLRAQQAEGCSLVYSHDPDQWAALGPEL
jgi:glyoxylase-like metal-dependent hydrolase (beta-lactamase superfamily II)